MATKKTGGRKPKPERPRRLEFMPLSSLREAPRNPKAHHQHLGSSVERFGFVDAPILDERTGRLVAGHGRRNDLLQKKAAGQDPPEGIQLGTAGEWLVPVQRGWSSRSDAEAEALLLAHNRIGEAGGWEPEQLTTLLADLSKQEVDLTGLGWSSEELQGLVEELGRPSDVTGGEDPGAGEVPAEPVSKRGEVYLLGPAPGHRLMCGDATSKEDVAKLLGGEKPRLMVTDPPYGVEYDPWARDEVGVARNTRLGAVESDDRAEWGEAYTLFGGHVVYAWCASLFLPEAVGAVEGAGFIRRSLIVWKKGTFTLSRGHYHWAHEPCIYAVRKGETAMWAGDRKQTTVWEIAQVGGFGSSRDEGDVSTSHGTQKPLECMERPIRNHEGDVYDPFVGSGTTIIAAARQERRSFTMEIHPAYVDVCRKRYGDYARLINLGPGPGAL